jgi:uncharacterized protein (TIGR02246 family)
MIPARSSAAARPIGTRAGVALLFAWSLALATAHAVSPYGGGEAVDEEAVSDLAWRNAAAWNAHDALAWAETFAPDAELAASGAEPVEGRDAIRAYAARLFSGAYAHSMLRIRKVRVRLQSKDIASVDRVQLVDLPGEAGAGKERTETVFFLARKDGGRWTFTLMRDAPGPVASARG